MPRTSNAKNVSYYHYIVHTFDEQGNKIESKYHKTQKEITDQYKLNRSAIYYILNPVENRIARIKHNIKIERVFVPVYKSIMTNKIIPHCPPPNKPLPPIPTHEVPFVKI